MPFLTYDPFPQCLQQSPLTPLLLARVTSEEVGAIYQTLSVSERRRLHLGVCLRPSGLAGQEARHRLPVLPVPRRSARDLARPCRTVLPPLWTDHHNPSKDGQKRASRARRIRVDARAPPEGGQRRRAAPRDRRPARTRA